MISVQAISSPCHSRGTARARLAGVYPLLLFAVFLPAVGLASGDVPVGRGEDLRIKPPLPVWPSDFEALTERSPTFRLNGRFGATAYWVELARDRDFAAPIRLRRFEITDEAGITPVVLVAFDHEPLEDGQYYWRTFAGDADGFVTPPANYRTFFVAEADPEPIIEPSENFRPRLYLGASDLPALRARIARSEHARLGWQYFSNAAYSMLDAEPPGEDYARAAPGQHGNYNYAAAWYHRHMGTMAFVAHVTEDPRLAHKAIEMLMAACAYERWLGPLFDDARHFDPPWMSALETAMMTQAVAIAYDLLHLQLSETQRQTVRAAIVEKGIRPLVREWADPVGSSRLPRHQLPTGNWVMVCSASAGVGALALLGEHPEAPEWVRLVRNRVRAWLQDRGGDWYADNPFIHQRPHPIPIIGPSEPNFGIDGGYKESIGYMAYAMHYVCYFADGLLRVSGQSLFDDMPANMLDHVAWSVLAWPTAEGTKSAMIDFGDCGPSPNFHELYTAWMRNRRDGLAAWLYHRTTAYPLSPRSLAWYDDSVVETPPDASVPMRAFRGIGQVICRNGWSPRSPLAAIKFYQNRGNLDLGTFYLFGAGQPTLIDSGITGYGTSIYREYSSQSVAHNVVLVDGASQTRTDGKMLAAVATSAMAAASGELAAAYPQALHSWKRDLLLLPGGLAVVADELEGRGPRQFDLVLHPESPFRLEDPDMLVIGAGPGAAQVSVQSDAPFIAVLQDGYYQASPRQYARFNSAAPAERQTFVTVCRWPKDARGASSLLAGGHNSDNRGTAGAEHGRYVSPGRWRLDDRTLTCRLALRIGGADDERVLTDARVAAVWEHGHRTQRAHALLLGGRQLAVDGRNLLRSTEPVNVAAEFDLPLRASFWSDSPARVMLAADQRISQVDLNGLSIDVQWHEGTISFDLPAGQSELLGSDFRRPSGRLPPLAVEDLAAVTAPARAAAFQPNVRARSSSCLPEALMALDGDLNTGWWSLPGLPLPQWLEVDLPAAEVIGQVSILTGQASEGRVQVAGAAGSEWVEVGSFVATEEDGAATLSFPPVLVRRIRVTVEKAGSAGHATIQELQWHKE